MPIYFHTSEEMSEVKDQSVDLVVTHPPYYDPAKKLENLDVIGNVFDECFKRLKDDRYFISVNTDTIFEGIYAKHVDLLSEAVRAGFRLVDYKVWLKSDFSGWARLNFAHILILAKGHPKRVKANKHYHAGVWYLQKEPAGGFKDNFPEELVRRFVVTMTQKGDTVLDPFLGIGTTLKVAQSLGRNAIGYEIDKKLIKHYNQK